MAGLAVTVTLIIFSLFLLSHAENDAVDLPLPDSSSELAILPSNHPAELPGSNAVDVFSKDRLQPSQLDNQIVEWNPSISNDLRESDSKSAIFHSNHVVPSEMVAGAEATNAAELPRSDYGFHFHSHCHHQKEEKPLEKRKNQGFHFNFRFPFGFHFHSHCHHHEKEEREREMEMEKQFKPQIDGEEIPISEDMIKARTARFHHDKPIGDDEGMMRFEEGKKKGSKKEWKKEKKDDDEGMMRIEEGKINRHKKEWKKENGGDGEGKMRFEESKMKHHKKEERKKEKGDGEGKMKRHKKEWKKNKGDAGLMKLFRKFFKHFRKFYKHFT